MVKLIDGTLLVGTISVDEQFLRIENPLMLTTVQRMTEYGLKDDSSLSPWIPFTSDEKFNISKDTLLLINKLTEEQLDIVTNLFDKEEFEFEPKTNSPVNDDSSDTSDDDSSDSEPVIGEKIIVNKSKIYLNCFQSYRQ